MGSSSAANGESSRASSDLPSAILPQEAPPRGRKPRDTDSIGLKSRLSFQELAIIRKMAGDGNPPVDIQKNLAKARVQVIKRQMKRKTNVKCSGPDLTSVRRALKGYTLPG